MIGLLVTGTDTGVGKTVVAVGLAQLLRARGFSVGALKPVETGCVGLPADGQLLAEAIGETELAAVVPCTYLEPLAPLVAGRRSGKPVDLDRIEAAWQRWQDRQLTLVEGAGGLSVPLEVGLDYAGLAARWSLRVIVVARPNLGTLNHTFLTVTYARQRGLTVLGVVICGYPEHPDAAELTNPSMIEELCATPVLGLVPRWPRIERTSDAAAAVARSSLLERLLPCLGSDL